MIDKYTDHSANERTYLSWIRTAVGIMAFGFLIEKFDLFVANIGTIERSSDAFVSAEVVGLGFFAVGVLIILNASARYYLLKKLIDSDQRFSYGIMKSNAILIFLMILLIIFLLVYMSHKILV